MSNETTRQLVQETQELMTDIRRNYVEKFSQRIDTLETEVVRLKAPGYDLSESGLPGSEKGKPFGGALKSEGFRAFGKFLRKGKEGMEPYEFKTLVISNNPQAGYLAPPEFANEIIKGVSEFSPIRTVAKIRTTNRESLGVPRERPWARLPG